MGGWNISYTVHTEDSVWRRRADKLLSASTVSAELFFEKLDSCTDQSFSFSPNKVQHQVPETSVPGANVAPGRSETPAQLSTEETLPSVDKADVPVELSYPAQEPLLT